MSEENRVYVCCLCGKDCEGYGFNPWPLRDGEDDCCETCDGTKVRQARERLIGRRIVAAVAGAGEQALDDGAHQRPHIRWSGPPDGSAITKLHAH
jgi:hypothetical protein